MNRIATILASCALAAGLFVPVTNVQAQTRPAAKADIPFDFIVANHRMPAGSYRIERLSPQLLAVSNENGRANSFVQVIPTRSSKVADHGKLIFHRYGTVNYLAQLWSGGENMGSECIRSKGEKEAATSKTADEVAINLLPVSNSGR